MQALELTDIKDFMNSAASYVIDGRVNKGFYSENELEELSLKDCSFLPYAMLRGNFFDLIKGKKTPSSFKFVLLLSPENLRRTLTSTGSSFSENDSGQRVGSTGPAVFKAARNCL